MPSSLRARPTVFFHIGPPKTGTTYLQGILRHWHRELKRAGVLFPGIPSLDHFPAALDARGDHGFGHGSGRDTPRANAIGAWRRLVEKAKAFDGTVVISHEVFASADAAHAAAAVRDLTDTDLHVVVTARDPGRQLVSTWQEKVKHGNPQPFHSTDRRPGKALPPNQRIPELLRRWGSTLSSDHVHVVTVPPAGSDPTLLWKRFATVIRADPERFHSLPASRSNSSLGVAEIELLRRVNVALANRLPHPAYGRFVTRMYADEILAAVSSSPPPALPAELRPTAARLAEEWIHEIRSRRYDVCGDLDDLLPRYVEGPPPDGGSQADMTEAAITATAELLLEVSRLSEPGEAARRMARAAAADGTFWLLGVTHRYKNWASRLTALRSSSRSSAEPLGDATSRSGWPGSA